MSLAPSMADWKPDPQRRLTVRFQSLRAAPGLERNVTSHVGILGGLLHLKESNGVLKYRNDDFLLTFPKKTLGNELGVNASSLNGGGASNNGHMMKC